MWAPRYEQLAKIHIRVNFVKAVLHEVEFIQPPRAFPTNYFYTNGKLAGEIRGLDEEGFLATLNRLSPESTSADWSDFGSGRTLGSNREGVSVAARAAGLMPKAAPAQLPKPEEAQAEGTCQPVPDAEMLACVCALDVPEHLAYRALVETNNESVEAAVNRAFELMDEAASAVHDDDQEYVCGPDGCSIEAPSATPVSDDTRSAEEIAAEFQVRAQQRRDEARRADETKKQESERQRIDAGKKAQEEKEKFDQEQKLRDYDESRREAELDAQWRREVLAKIKRQQQQREMDARSSLLEAAPAVEPVAPRYNPSAHATAELQIRMPDGSRLRNKFQSSDTIQTVQNWIDVNHAPSGLYYLQTPAAPVQLFQGDKIFTTLGAAGLAPRGVLVLKLLQL